MTRHLPLLFALFCSAPLFAFDIVVDVQHATCGNATGGAWAYAVGGVPPYAFNWSDGTTGPHITNAPPGIYTLIVTDSNGDEAAADVEITATDALFPPFIPAQPAWSCDDGCNASFHVYVPLGSAMPYTVISYPPGPTGSASPNGIYLNHLCPGESYMVTVVDANGCTGVLGPIDVLGDMAPDVVSTSVSGSCPGGATGSLTILFSQADSITVHGPGGMLSLPTANPYTANNLAPGTYTVTAYALQAATSPPGTSGGASCPTEVVIEVPLSTAPCGEVNGVLYADLNADCEQGATDPGMPYRVISIGPGGHWILTDQDGQFHTELFFGDHALNAAPAGYAPVCPELPAPFTLEELSTAATINVAMEPLSGPDASAFLSMGVHVPGFPVNYHVSAHNQGPFTFPGSTLDLFFDPLLILTDGDGGTLIAPGHLQWALGDLAPYSHAAFTIGFTVPANAALIGTTVTGVANLQTGQQDANPANNTYSVTTTIVGAYDPNDKLVQTSTRSSDAYFFLDLDDWVDYTIRFQNTGTAPAHHVYLLDTIAPELDLASLQILHASHAFTASLLPGRVLRFDFPEIMLPDSSSDMAGSQGFAGFRLRPVDGLTPGQALVNFADIFFDFNEPIRTNDATLVADLSTGIDAPTARMDVLVFPVPVEDRLHAIVPDGPWSAAVFAMDGRMVMSARTTGPRLTLDAAALAPGGYILRLSGPDGTVLNTRFVKR